MPPQTIIIYCINHPTPYKIYEDIRNNMWRKLWILMLIGDLGDFLNILAEMRSTPLLDIGTFLDKNWMFYFLCKFELKSGGKCQDLQYKEKQNFLNKSHQNFDIFHLSYKITSRPTIAWIIQKLFCLHL